MILSSSGEMFVNGAAAVMNPLGLHLGLPGAASTPHLSQAAALTAALRSSQPNGISALAIAPAPTEIVPLLQEMKGNWNNSPAGSTKQDTNKHFHIFVGDLSSDVETQQLREAFTPFGEISDCRVVRDPQTQKSKGYGFVSFLRKQDAETAINSMNGQWLGGRVIRTNWATRRPTSNANGGQEGSQGSNTPKYTPLTFDEVYNQASPTNCTVYCGGLGQGLSEELIQKTFSSYGIIQEIRVFKDKGYAFVRFATKESATHAIVAVHNTEVNGQIVKCSWGKESSDPNNQQVQQHTIAAAQIPYHQYQQMNYWYPQNYAQPGQFVQGTTPTAVQYQYGQYFGNGFGMGLQVAWPAGQGGQSAPLGQQPASLLPATTYPMQQYQTHQ
ncbi:nucleolysin TIAR-like [Varroa jacobsoni]|uniref:nucleolysin TIAR-like n=1 Tax=Varroa jacobsoni TaxID=62625 RepID=UPI000BF651F2|nr:nucleolysin TIAR-like [Varroa jacobsoni]